MDIIKSNEITDQVEYLLFRQNGEHIDLSPFVNYTVIISFPIKDSSDFNYDMAKKFHHNNINVFNKRDVFYNDYCIPYNESGIDMIVAGKFHPPHPPWGV